MFQKTRVDLDSRVLVIFFKEEVVWKVELSSAIDSLYQEMNILKTMYKKQEKYQERHEQVVQDILDNMKLLLQN